MKWYRSIVQLAVAAIVLSLGVQDAEANSARRHSLDGNRLIEDRNDIFQYPQLATNYASRIGFDYDGADDQGSALMLMGNDSMAYGVALHRGDLLRNNLFPYDPEDQFLTGAPQPLLGGYPAQGNIVDFLIGFDVGGGLAGARLSLGRGATDSQPADGDPSSNSQTLFRLDGGYSMTGAMTLDTSVSLLYASAETIEGGDTTEEGSMFGVGVSGRGYTDLGQPFELGFIADVVFTNTSNTNVDPDPDVERDQSFLGLQAGAGPVWEIDDEAIVAAYGVIGYQRNKEDPNTDENAEDGGAGAAYSGDTQVILPGFQIGADVALNDWLAFRSGAHYLWNVTGTFSETPDGDDETGASGSGGFGWNAGLGAEFGNLRIDGSLQHNFLVSGPNFIGGGSTFLALTSAEYAWE